MDERGYISLAGRLKEIIIRGGENISPTEIELCLGSLEGVAEVAVVGVPDERLGEIVAAVVRVDPSVSDVVALIDRLRAEARAKLAPYKVPSRWFLAEVLPTTPTGKVRKFAVTGSITGGSMREIHPTP
jgi:fatty-acyl-CoA synthase/long-chain acyl-CoA synthetase